jgi:dipeptidyl aminopeptidase/acylaminoacyl peptidase
VQVTDANASKEFVDKLKAAGKPAEYVPFEGESELGC